MTDMTTLPPLEWKEGKALLYMLNGRSEDARHTLQQMTVQELDRLTDALDALAAKVDEEAIRRAEKRR